MPLPLPLPVTLITASILALLGLVLGFRVSVGRAKFRVSIGDGGNAELVTRMRTHANFVEYVPLLLVLMAALELSQVNRVGLMAMGVLLIVFRLMHAIGMPRPAPNIFRATGALGTYGLTAAAALWGLYLALSA